MGGSARARTCSSGVYAVDVEHLRAALASILAADADGGVELVHLQRAEALAGGRDHFGFFDGIAQPAFAGAGVAPRPGDGQPDGAGGWREVATGEVLLGYVDEDGTQPVAPLAPFDRNGTFVVYRKLAMDVAAFRRFIASQDAYPGGPNLLAAKIVGRWPDGTPLAVSPERPDGAVSSDPLRINDFGYEDDPGGLKCPLGAHIRRANPRDDPAFFNGRLTNRHRIVRRGRAYGVPLAPRAEEDDGVDRGLVFICFQADIWRQFETIQALWIDDGDPFGLGRDKDFLVGEPHGTDGQDDDPGFAAVLLEAPAALRHAARRRLPLPAVDDRRCDTWPPATSVESGPARTTPRGRVGASAGGAALDFSHVEVECGTPVKSRACGRRPRGACASRCGAGSRPRTGLRAG